MKIAIVMPLATQRGGGELMLIHLMQQGQDLGVEWRVIFLEDGPMVAHVNKLGAATDVIEAGQLRNLPRFASTVSQLADILRRKQADVVLGWMAKAHLYAGMAARKAGIPAIWYQLGIPLDKHWLDRLATRIPAKGILTCSQAGANAQATLMPCRPMQIVHPGVELERFDRSLLPTADAMRIQLGLPKEGPLIGIVGRLQRWKGIHVLLQAMPEVLSRHSNAHCLIVGGAHDLEPDYQAFLNEQIAALGLAEHVTMTGLQQNVPEWMQAMDVFVHASDREPFGIVIIEAMALGKPVIAGDAAGPTEIITDGVEGLLTPFGDADALAKAILRCLHDSEFAQDLGAAARRRAMEFSTSRYARNLINAVEQLTGFPGKVPL